ncbi:MAG: hypothetical protein AB7N80_07505 [Bdellovibrionales bacterium]
MIRIHLQGSPELQRQAKTSVQRALLFFLMSPVVFYLSGLVVWFYLVLPSLHGYFLSPQFFGQIDSFSLYPEATQSVVELNFNFWVLVIPCLLLFVLAGLFGVFDGIRTRNPVLLELNKRSGWISLLVGLFLIFGVFSSVAPNWRLFASGLSPIRISKVVQFEKTKNIPYKAGANR